MDSHAHTLTGASHVLLGEPHEAARSLPPHAAAAERDVLQHRQKTGKLAQKYVYMTVLGGAVGSPRFPAPRVVTRRAARLRLSVRLPLRCSRPTLLGV